VGQSVRIWHIATHKVRWGKTEGAIFTLLEKDFQNTATRFHFE
jgi:hypothetical protein